MKFAKYLDAHKRAAWQQHYTDYRALKKKLKGILDTGYIAAPGDFYAGLQSLSVMRAVMQNTSGTAAEESFLVSLQQEIAKVATFTERTAEDLRAQLSDLKSRSLQLRISDPVALRSEARRLGDDVLQLERFVQLNQAAFVKIIKKHDKLNPDAPIWHLYVNHLQHQPWVHDGHTDLWSLVSGVFSDLHSAAAASTTAAPGAGTSPRASRGGAPSGFGSTASGNAVSDDSMTKDVYKYWVSLDDVSSVMYYILQHLPLLPSSAHMKQHQEEGTFGASSESYSTAGEATLHSPNDGCMPGRTDGNDASSSAVSISRRGGGNFPGCSATVHTVYLDNSVLELYHGRLYLRPNARTLKVQWVGRDGSEASEGYVPRKVVIERKIYREGWKGEPNFKSAMLVPGDKLPGFLDGSFTLNDVLGQMHQAAVQASGTLPDAASAAIRCPSMALQKATSEPEDMSCAVASAAAAAEEAGMSPAAAPPAASQFLSPSPSPPTAVTPAQGAEVSALPDPQHQPPDDQLQQQPQLHAQLEADVPNHPTDPAQDVPLVSPFAAPSVQQTAAPQQQGPAQEPPTYTGLLAGMLSSSTVDRCGSPTDVGYVGLQHHANASTSGAYPETPGAESSNVVMGLSSGANQSAATPPGLRVSHGSMSSLHGYMDDTDDEDEEFEDTYLSPPVGSDQLALFSEVQRLVQRKGLQPVVHCVSQRLLFQMPFDTSIRITLDTDVCMKQKEMHHSHADVRHTVSLGSVGIEPTAPQTPSIQTAATAPAVNGHQHLAPDQHSAATSQLYTEDVATSPDSYTLPYALLKVSTVLRSGTGPPAWLKTLMQSEYVIEVDQWSKFVHGCAVLMPDTVRAVPYWIDDELIQLSTVKMQSALDVRMMRDDSEVGSDPGGEESIAGNSNHGSGHHAADVNHASGKWMSSNATMAGTSIQSGGSGFGHAISSPLPSRRPQTGSGVKQGLGFVIGFLRRGMGNHATRSVPIPNAIQRAAAGHHRQGSATSLSAASISSPGSAAGSSPPAAGNSPLQGDHYNLSAVPPQQQQHSAQHHVRWQGLGGVAAVSSESSLQNGVTSASVNGASTNTMYWPWLTASSARIGHRDDWIVRWTRHKNPHLKGHPVQLVECRDFLNNETTFMDWLKMAVLMSSAAVLLLAFSAMAYIDPRKHVEIHVAETITLMLLPTSCIMVVYAMWLYLWRSRRMNSMRFKRFDDMFGPNVIIIIIVAALCVILLVNAADLAIIIEKARKHHPVDPGTDPPDTGDLTHNGSTAETLLQCLLSPWQQE